MGERRGAQAVPVKAAALGMQPELAGQLDQTRHRHRLVIEQIAPAHGPDCGVNPVLRPEPKKAAKPRLARNDIARRRIGGRVDAHPSNSPAINCTRYRCCKTLVYSNRMPCSCKCWVT